MSEGTWDQETLSEAAGDYPVGHSVPGPNVVIRKVIGRGGHATVYAAEFPLIERKIALKVIHPHLARNPDIAQRFLAEAKTLVKLDHPNVVKCENAGFTTDDRHLAYIQMELLRGISGRKLLELRKRLAIPNALEVACDLASGLEAAHALHVVHQDLKPDNVFIHMESSGKAVAKLYDFGIQALYDPKLATQEASEEARHFEGTVAYAAPEQLRGERVTPLTDVYAFGVLLYEFVTGVHPFEDIDGNASFMDLAHAHMNAVPPRLSDQLLVPKALEDLVARCLAKNPADRPQSVKAIGQELRAILQSLDPVFARSSTTTQDFLSSVVHQVRVAKKPSFEKTSDVEQAPTELPAPSSPSGERQSALRAPMTLGGTHTPIEPATRERNWPAWILALTLGVFAPLAGAAGYALVRISHRNAAANVAPAAANAAPVAVTSAEPAKPTAPAATAAHTVAAAAEPSPTSRAVTTDDAPQAASAAPPPSTAPPAAAPAAVPTTTTTPAAAPPAARTRPSSTGSSRARPAASAAAEKAGSGWLER